MNNEKIKLLKLLKSFFNDEKIEYYSAIPISSCRIKKPYLLEKYSIPESGSVLIILAPYYTGEYKGDRNLSLYAVPMNYHIYFDNLFSRLCELLKSMFPGRSFHGFSDHSPIDEVYSASTAGLGVIGDNNMLINEKYSSFVFIGGVFSDMPAEDYGDIYNLTESSECIHCGKCKKICPDTQNCLSSVTQKKGNLTENEADMLVKHNSVWGCDMCQTVCPMVTPQITEIDFFKSSLIHNLTEEMLDSMSDEEFELRAFSWRGRNTIMRNLKIINKRI